MTAADTTATKTKRTKTDTVRPPREILNDTKARRAWLADKVAELNAQPNTEAKIVGTGSYQEVSVYTLTQVEGRLRLRGVCQFCGNLQVVDGGTLVLHGYARPGDGAIYGRCPGVHNKPLNVDNTATAKWVTYYTALAATATVNRDAAAAAEQAAELAASAEREANRLDVRPNEPRRVAAWTDKYKEYEAALAAWVVRNPLRNALRDAQVRHTALRNDVYQLNATVRHLQALLDGPVHGSPLTEEVVA